MAAPSRILVAAFGDPGHAFPAIALGRALTRRGHEVVVETWSRWRPHVESEGMCFAPAPEFDAGQPTGPYALAPRAARLTRELVRELRPAAVVADILTVPAALAAELEGAPWVTLVPHLLPTPEPGMPPFSSGARPARTRVGRAAWRALDPISSAGARLGREQLGRARAELGLPPLAHLHGGISRALALVATFPQLEYARRSRPPGVRVTGPLLWEPPAPPVEAPPGHAPLVLVAPSTSQDPGQRMLAAALEGLAHEPVRVLAVHGPGGPPEGLRVPANARVVAWASYALTMPLSDAVVCHGGHGTLARALANGVPVLACPAAGDMAENGARLGWAGVGVALPRRLTNPRAIRLAVRRLLADERMAERTRAIGRWANCNDGGEQAAVEIERLIAAAAR